MVRAGPGTAKLLFFARWLLPSRWRAVKEIKKRRILRVLALADPCWAQLGTFLKHANGNVGESRLGDLNQKGTMPNWMYQSKATVLHARNMLATARSKPELCKAKIA